MSALPHPCLRALVHSCIPAFRAFLPSCIFLPFLPSCLPCLRAFRLTVRQPLPCICTARISLGFGRGQECVRGIGQRRQRAGRVRRTEAPRRRAEQRHRRDQLEHIDPRTHQRRKRNSGAQLVEGRGGSRKQTCTTAPGREGRPRPPRRRLCHRSARPGSCQDPAVAETRTRSSDCACDRNAVRREPSRIRCRGRPELV